MRVHPVAEHLKLGRLGQGPGFFGLVFLEGPFPPELDGEVERAPAEDEGQPRDDQAQVGEKLAGMKRLSREDTLDEKRHPDHDIGAGKGKKESPKRNRKDGVILDSYSPIEVADGESDQKGGRHGGSGGCEWLWTAASHRPIGDGQENQAEEPSGRMEDPEKAMTSLEIRQCLDLPLFRASVYLYRKFQASCNEIFSPAGPAQAAIASIPVIPSG